MGRLGLQLLSPECSLCLYAICPIQLNAAGPVNYPNDKRQEEVVDEEYPNRV